VALREAFTAARQVGRNRCLQIGSGAAEADRRVDGGG
jgi:hypothetical protein